LLADAQTSGGLLISLPSGEAESYLSEVRKKGCPDAGIIGEIIEKQDSHIIIQ